MRAPLLSLLLVACTGSGGADTAPGGTPPGGTPHGADGAVFKGPLAEGSEVEWVRLDDDAFETGEEGEAYITNHLGDYSLTMPSQGFLKIEAEGAYFDEATGGQKEVPIKIATYVLLEPGEPVAVQINLLTDLLSSRMLDRLQGGQEYDEALLELEDELFDALDIGFGEPLALSAHEVSPWEDSYESAYLFAVSAVIAEAAEAQRLAGEGDIDTLLETLREDFRDDGDLEPGIAGVIADAERTLDPDLAVTSIRMLAADLGEDRPIPDPHQVLDSDGDGVVNADDNCRYVANPDQAAAGGYAWGDACDDRLRAISTGDQTGCGVRAVDGALVCWDSELGRFGGTAPSPWVLPAGRVRPWPAGEGLDGAYVDVSVDELMFCAVQEAGPIDCWSPAVGRFGVDGDFRRVEASRSRVCGIDDDDRLTCVDLTGQPLLQGLGPVVDFALVAGDQLLTIDAADGTLAWHDTGGGLGALPLPSGTFTRLESGGGEIGDTPWACALSAVDGSVVCLGETPLAAGAPTGTGFTELAVGDGVACVARAGELPTCWRDAEVCPEVQAPPAAVAELTADGCQIAGIGDDALGRSWPRRWYGERIDYTNF